MCSNEQIPVKLVDLMSRIAQKTLETSDIAVSFEGTGNANCYPVDIRSVHASKGDVVGTHMKHDIRIAAIYFVIVICNL